MDQRFASHFVDCLNNLDAAQAEALGQRVAAFHRTAAADEKMPYPVYFDFMLAMCYQAMQNREEVTVLLDGISIRRSGFEPLVLPFGVDTPEFAEYCRTLAE